jgi:alanine dehydrogenase
MRIGVPKEIKPQEYRVGLTPASVAELVAAGRSVFVEHGAGIGSGFPDADYEKAGAEIVSDAGRLFELADMIVKVKEPQPQECQMLRAGQILFAYLHLAPDETLSRRLVNSGATCIAYETITDNQGRLPLLTPMSRVAGRVAVQEGAHHLCKPQGGRGLLLAGVEGVEPAQALVLGAGVVGENAMQVALGMGARVTVLDKSEKRLEQLVQTYGERARFELSTEAQISRYLPQADLVIGAVLTPGGKAPMVINREHLALMNEGAVLVDVAIDQGGCFETSRPTTHSEPTFIVDGIVHYCVTNMPSSVARTATLALNQATLPYVLKLSSGGIQALLADEHLRNGLNVHKGKITLEVVARDQGLEYVPALSALESS